MSKPATVSSVSLAAVAIFVLSSAWQAASAQVQSAVSSNQTYTDHSPVVSPYKESFPLTYGEWGARWWQYVIGIPACSDGSPAPCSSPAQILNPLLDPTGAKCQVGQWGPVFFLAGTATPAPVTRSCDVPGGTGLFFPIINIFCAVPEDGDTTNFTNICKAAIDGVDPKSLLVTIDGKKVQNLYRYFRASEFFAFTGVGGNVDEPNGCGTPPCYVGFREPAYSDGYWVMLTPLSPGQHTIHFEAAVLSTDPFYPFTQNVTYKLKVLPPQ
jgi:hypothetical protein